MLQHISISIQIIFRELVVSSLKVTEFKITKYIKRPLWQCGSIRLVCIYDVLCGGFKLTDFNEETTSSLKMI